MIFHIGEHEIDTDKVRRWVNSSRGRTLAFWLTSVGVVALLAAVWWTFLRGWSHSSEDLTSCVLYTSADDTVVRSVVDAFEAETGIKVRVVTDTEATRGALVQRLLSEKQSPRADVWWSSEIVGSVQLASQGVLAPWASKSEATFPGGWPKHLRPSDRRWYGFATRARVIAFDTAKLNASSAPQRVRDLLRPDLKNRIGIADPRFGTTRTHMAYLLTIHGEEPFSAWLKGLAEQNVQVYPSNSAVVQAINKGDISAGLTDTDDVWAAQKQGWAVSLVNELPDRPRERFTGLPCQGTLVIPNTVARITGSPNNQAGNRLADFILSERVERLLADSDSKNVPVRPDLAKQYPKNAIKDPAPVDFAKVAENEERAAAIATRLLGIK